MQQSWDVLLVIVHAEIRLDPMLHHRAVPHPSGEARSLWASLDNLLEPRQLLVAQSMRRPRREASP